MRQFELIVCDVFNILKDAQKALTSAELEELARKKLAPDDMPASEDAVATLVRRGHVIITRDYKLRAAGEQPDVRTNRECRPR